MAFWNKILKKQRAEEGKSREAAEKAEAVQGDGKPSVPAGLRVEVGRQSEAAGRNVLRAPRITEKTSHMAKQNKYVFSVDAEAGKAEVRSAVESRYGVRVTRVRMISLPPKKRTRGRQVGWKRGVRKAIVAIKEGQTIEIQ